MKLSTFFATAALATAIASPVFAQTAAAPAPTPAPAAPAAAPADAAPAPAPAAPAAAAPGGKIAPSGDIVATLTASGQFTTLLKALDEVNLTGLLKSPGPLTLFAPTDAAFAALPAGTLDKLMADKAGLQQLLAYHLVNSKVDSSKIVGAKGPIPTAANKPVYVDGSAGAAKVNDAVIAQTDLTVSNGVIYPVDHVLMPTFTPPAATAEAAPAADAPDVKPAAKGKATRKK